MLDGPLSHEHRQGAARQLIADTLHELDRLPQAVSPFEANCLETMLRQLRQGRLPSVKQHRILLEMCEKYLRDSCLQSRLHALTPR